MRYWLLTHKVFVRTFVMAIVFLSTTFYPRTAVNAQVIGAFEGHWWGIVQCQSGAYGYRDWYIQQGYGYLSGRVSISTDAGTLRGQLKTFFTADITETFNSGTTFTYAITKDRYADKISGKLVPDSPVHGACTITMDRISY